MKLNFISKGLSLIVIFALGLIASIPVSAVYASSPAITLSPDSGEAGTTVTITGSHFTEDYYYYVFFDKTYKAKGTINSSGKFTRSITIPSSKDAGDYKIVVKADEDSNSSPEYTDDYDESASAEYEVTEDEAYINLDKTVGQAGSSVVINGYDFDDDNYYYVFFDEELMGKGAIDDNGEFTKTISIPDDADSDDYTIEVLTKNYNDSNAEYDDNDWQDESDSTSFKVIEDSTPTPVINQNIPILELATITPQTANNTVPDPVINNQTTNPNMASQAAVPQNNNNLTNQNGNNGNGNANANGNVNSNGNGNNSNGQGQGFFSHFASGFNWVKNHMPW